jgi:hypothetical protein
MFGDLKLELRWNFKVPHALGVLIHLNPLRMESCLVTSQKYSAVLDLP